jgi:YegS/Rv2252/BmrU family lipid kinase
VQPAVLIYNPASGSHNARRLPAVGDALGRSGYAAEPRPTAAPGDATSIARRAAADGAAAVFAMGGDGTLREVAAGLLGGGLKSTPPLGFLPAGTANVLVRSLGLPRNALDAAEGMRDCRPRPIDAGVVETTAGDRTPFLMMASCGLDAAVMTRRQSPRLKKLLGRAAFTLGTLETWLRYTYPEIVVRRPDAELRGSLVVVANVPLYGGDFRMAPAADFEDGKLDLVVFKGGRRATLSLGWDLARGRHTARFDVTTAAVRQVEVDAPEGVRMQVDGDLLPAPPPWTVRLAAERLNVLLPRAQTPLPGLRKGLVKLPS